MLMGFLLYFFYGVHHAQFIGIIRIEKVFGLAPKNPLPIEPHTERTHAHPICEREFEKEIWEFEEDNDLPHEMHITQIEKIEAENKKHKELIETLLNRVNMLESKLNISHTPRDQIDLVVEETPKPVDEEE